MIEIILALEFLAVIAFIALIVGIVLCIFFAFAAILQWILRIIIFLLGLILVFLVVNLIMNIIVPKYAPIPCRDRGDWTTAILMIIGYVVFYHFAKMFLLWLINIL